MKHDRRQMPREAVDLNNIDMMRRALHHRNRTGSASRWTVQQRGFCCAG